MVVIPGGVAVGRTEVMQREWDALMSRNPSYFKNCADCPVEEVNWDDVQDYLKKLSQKAGKIYRLPSEEEWDRACRAGSQQAYCGSDNLDSVGWDYGNSGGKTRPVASKQPNAWGIFDMSGNVVEWTDSCWMNNCDQRVLRGGSWVKGVLRISRAADRIMFNAAHRYIFLGFRPARTLP
jgi:formylglycine-generating enzyme required for sulfatase activity